MCKAFSTTKGGIHIGSVWADTVSSGKEPPKFQSDAVPRSSETVTTSYKSTRFHNRRPQNERNEKSIYLLWLSLTDQINTTRTSKKRHIDTSVLRPYHFADRCTDSNGQETPTRLLFTQQKRQQAPSSHSTVTRTHTYSTVQYRRTKRGARKETNRCSCRESILGRASRGR
jgi:hypothetical protein